MGAMVNPGFNLKTEGGSLSSSKEVSENEWHILSEAGFGLWVITEDKS